MTQRRLARLLTVVMFAYMAGFVALYLDRLWPTFQAIEKALGA